MPNEQKDLLQQQKIQSAAYSVQKSKSNSFKK